MDILDTAKAVPDFYHHDYLKHLKRAIARGERREVSDGEVHAVARINTLDLGGQPLFVVPGGRFNDAHLLAIEHELRDILRIHGLPEKRWSSFGHSSRYYIAALAYRALHDVRRWRHWVKKVIGEKGVSGSPGSPHAIGQEVSAGAVADAGKGRPDGGPADDPSLALALTMVSYYSYRVSMWLHDLEDRVPEWPDVKAAHRLANVRPRRWKQQEQLYDLIRDEYEEVSKLHPEWPSWKVENRVARNRRVQERAAQLGIPIVPRTVRSALSKNQKV